MLEMNRLRKSKMKLHDVNLVKNLIFWGMYRNEMEVSV